MRSRLRALACAAGGALLVALLPVTPVSAADPVYTITGVSQASFYQGAPDLTACESKYHNPLTLMVQSTVENPTWGGQVSVTGLEVVAYSGGSSLGTVGTLDAALEPNGDLGTNYLQLSCRAWGNWLAQGFGGPHTDYQFRVIGPGQAYSSDDGSPVGTVQAPDTQFALTVPQLAKTTTPSGEKAGSDVELSTSMKAWRPTKAGQYSWRALGKREFVLYKAGRSGAFRKVDTDTSTRTGRVTVRFAAKRQNLVRFGIPGYTYGRPIYVVSKNGDVHLSSR